MMADVEIKLAAGITTIIRPYKQSVVYSASHLEAFGGGALLLFYLQIVVLKYPGN